MSQVIEHKEDEPASGKRIEQLFVAIGVDESGNEVIEDVAGEHKELWLIDAMAKYGRVDVVRFDHRRHAGTFTS